MNAVIILIVALIWLYLGYRFYGRFVEKRLKISDKRKTPAVLKKEKGEIDYSPAKKPFLVGHHFASIAGAGPIIGPILAVSLFGWLPTVLWVLLGVVFIGAMHDYMSLIASVRNKAKGVAEITKKYLNTRTGWIFGLMIWITLILIITVFGVSAADSIIGRPDLVVPLIGITIIALVMGMGVKKFKWDYKVSSIIAIILVFFFVYIGYKFPISLVINNPVVLKNIWITIIFSYAFLASIIPVWLLLRPRDYLSAIQMIIILFLGIAAFFIARPIINAPAYISNSVFPIWPILFITVACGAISGFHGLVSSGTTSKQLSKESHAKPVAYGAMLLEGLLAILVTVVVISGLKWIDFQATLEQGWIILFSSGFGNIVGNIVPVISVGIAGLLGAFMVNQFILTSVDTSTRLGRFILSETLVKKINNRILASIITLIPAYLLAITNSYETLWRLFGTSNQLIASITLIGISAFFISKKTISKKKMKFMIIPSLFVLITTLSALIYLTFRSGGYIAESNFGLAIISLLMFLLGIFVAFEGFNLLRRRG